ncbi:MAG: xanthine dehydrogenase family protein molybdopterin-binding subunit [Rhodospirillaceae bacterium]|jgi:isoquinoline 1-oxidoreductase subunit beta|nr:xanthine dehydrogenase family protein molybdopterin-binding subunit [Rhodospirillaceae bacterium]MBT5567369.1 xanthine dehydrogenase family protein molybdopterin-binding subunit [Rhodospirillaceae bacterium]MBT6089691.1 xanthine dehydrogenase family protein molybdopterin-binding subunit [Rhodospirillaceae bacterium]MBT7450114.1 xanthine dehydrogenase family protein molybdopterin-binding subunit [Rhodospirillaceae bacterium]
MKLSRRGLIVSGIAAGGGLAVAYGLNSLKDGDSKPKFGASTPEDAVLHAYVKISPSGIITVAVPQAELGQGITTAIPMLVAEELDANWEDVRYELSPLDKDYGSYVIAEAIPLLFMDPGALADYTRSALYKVTPLIGLIITGGSSSILGNYNYLRTVGAATRAMLVQAAAAELGVPKSELTTEKSKVIHAASGRSLTYGELAESAAAFAPPEENPVKDADEFKILEHWVKRLDTPEKSDGSAVYGIDVKIPGMLHAAIRHSPMFKGTLDTFDAQSAMARDGVIAVVPVQDNAVAVVAESTWIAQKALDDMAVTWTPPEGMPFSTSKALPNYTALFDAAEVNVLNEDETFTADWDRATTTVEAVYETPYLAHVCMEPMGCTALYEESETDDPEDAHITVWSPSQSIGQSASQAAKIAEVKKANVMVHATLMGGGFGRRADMDFVRQATAIAKQLPGTPVKLTWSREEDVQQDTYRPATASRFRAGLDDDGNITALDFVIVGKPVSSDFNTRNGTFSPMDPENDISMVMPMSDSPYAFPSIRLALNAQDNPVPNGNWRSVTNSHNAFYQEAFMDEVAEAAGKDPVVFRRELLAHKPDFVAALDALAEKGDWGKPLAEGPEGSRRGRGIAFVEAFGSTVGQIAEVTVAANGELTVDRVVTLVDPHTVVNPNIITAQVEGAVIDGLSAALYGQIDVEDGAVVQSNFDSYRMMTMAEVPVIETHIMAQGGHPGGMGEVGLPCVAPALTSAIYNATGQRIRSLPISVSGLVSV